MERRRRRLGLRPREFQEFQGYQGFDIRKMAFRVEDLQTGDHDRALHSHDLENDLGKNQKRLGRIRIGSFILTRNGGRKF
ncbi:hypothetical protein SUGI_0919430 [Cryptomeria japonica]|nr:hypothetical protein SUGI_0919430 [Cryptomeria japonica]